MVTIGKITFTPLLNFFNNSKDNIEEVPEILTEKDLEKLLFE
jgi:hypothetical protein